MINNILQSVKQFKQFKYKKNFNPFIIKFNIGR